MPVENPSSSDRIQRIRQRIEAGSALSPGAAASDSTDTRVGRIWRLEDGCCADLYKLSLITTGQSYDKTTTPVYPCQLVQWSNPLPADQVITLINLTGSIIQYYIGDASAVPFPSGLKYYDSIIAGGVITIPLNESKDQTALYFNYGNDTPCLGS